MNMRKIISLLLLMTCGLASLHAQKYTAEQVRQRINTVASETRTLQCDFTQTKQLRMLNDKMVSRGRMYYEQPSKLRWEYTSPYQYTFLLNGTKVWLKSSQHNDEIDVRQNKMFKEIARIMMNSVLGRCVSDSRDFKVSLQGSGNTWQAVMTPKSRTMSQLFKTVVIHFDMRLGYVSAVELTEKGGDKTVITLKNVKVNAPIHEKLFTAR